MDLNDFSKTPDGFWNLKGLKEKVKTLPELQGHDSRDWYFLTENGKPIRYLFKSFPYGSNEYFAELLVEEACKLIGVNCAHYELAEEQTKGVLSRDFLNHSGDSFISGEAFLTKHFRMAGSDLDSKLGNNLVDIKNFLSDSCPGDVVADIMSQLNLYFGIDCFFYQIDDQWNNWGFISNQGTLRLAPKFDNSRILGFSFSPSMSKLPHYLRLLETHVNNHRPEKGADFLESIFNRHSRKYKGRGSKLFTTLSYSKDTFNLKGMRLLKEACKQDPNFINVAYALRTIDADKVITRVEDRTGCTIPSLHAEWFRTVSAFSLQYTNSILKEYECNLKGVEDLDD